MTHFGLLCPVATGHLNSMTTLGYELQRRGHRVTLFGIPDARAKTLAAGLEFWAIGEAEFPAGSSAASFAELGKLSGLAALKYTITLFQQLTVMLLREAPKAIAIAKLSSSTLQAAIEKVLTEDASKQNAVRLQAAIRRAGGVSRAADIVEQVAQTGQPVLAQPSK